MRIAELHESSFTLKERLLFAFLAGLVAGAWIGCLAAYIVISMKQTA